MTRKDYVRLAAALREAYNRTGRIEALNAKQGGSPHGAGFGVQVVTECIVEALAADNPRFDGARFWAAVEKGTAA